MSLLFLPELALDLDSLYTEFKKHISNCGVVLEILFFQLLEYVISLEVCGNNSTPCVKSYPVLYSFHISIECFEGGVAEKNKLT